MRIAMISWESMYSIPVGGLAAHVTSLAEALARIGDDVHVFTRMGDGQSRYDVIGGVHHHRCPFDPRADFLTYVDRMGDAFAVEVVDERAVTEQQLLVLDATYLCPKDRSRHGTTLCLKRRASPVGPGCGGTGAG